MEGRVRTNQHPKDAFLLVLSRLLERMHYYGVWAMFFVYLYSHFGLDSRSDLYATISVLIAVSYLPQIVGALLGDLWFGNRALIIIGGGLSALGAFVLMIPTTTFAVSGFVLIMIGSGFYTPNLLAQFGKSYNKKMQLLDAGFVLLFLAINIGGFIGPYIASLARGADNFWLVFLIMGVLMLTSLFVFLNIKKKESKTEIVSSETNVRRTVYVIGSIVLLGLYWLGYYIVDEGRNLLVNDIISVLGDRYETPFSADIVRSLIFLSPMFLIQLVVVVLWSFFFYSRYIKLLFGFGFYFVVAYLLMNLPATLNESSLIIIIFSAVLAGLAEVHIAPVVLSIITKYSFSAYLATAISLSLWIPRLSIFVLGIIFKVESESNLLYFKWGLLFFGLMLFVLLTLFIIKNKKKV